MEKGGRYIESVEEMRYIKRSIASDISYNG